MPKPVYAPLIEQELVKMKQIWEEIISNLVKSVTNLVSWLSPLEMFINEEDEEDIHLSENFSRVYGRR